MISNFGVINLYINLILLCLLLSCGNKQPVTDKVKSNSPKIRDTIAANPETPKTGKSQISNAVSLYSKQELQIDTFSTFPPEIEGCACYYSNNKEEFNNEVYIYADDYNDNAFVSIGGKLTKFTLNKVDTLPGKHSIKTWKNKQYDLTIDIKQVGQIEETWQQQGTLKIKEKGGKEVLKNIYGECGC